MIQKLRLGISPCPNDTFIFQPIAEYLVDTAPFDLDIFLTDVEQLNAAARRGEPDVCKVSASALVHLLDEYWVLRVGGAMGFGCGPLVVSREAFAPETLHSRGVAIPGRMTTANLLLTLHGLAHPGPVGPRPEMSFEAIMPAVAKGEVEAGLIIHEGRFTFEGLGLTQILDLGQWWEQETGGPLPLGVIVMRRSLGAEAALAMEALIRKSLEMSRMRPDLAWPYITHHAQEMELEVVGRHIATYVNAFTQAIGIEGEKALRELLQKAFALEGKPMPQTPLFPQE